MRKNTILNVILVVVGLALSLFLGFGGWSIRENLGIRTPGMLVSDAFVSPKPFPRQFDAVGEGLSVQMFVDWIFWFAVMYLVYFLVKKLNRRSKVPH